MRGVLLGIGRYFCSAWENFDYMYAYVYGIKCQWEGTSKHREDQVKEQREAM